MPEEKLTEIIREGEVREEGQYEVRYMRPSFSRRVMANLLDLIIFAFVFFGLLIGTRAIASNTPTFKANTNQINNIRILSGIYAYDDHNQLKDLVTFINQDTNNTGGSKVSKAKKGINTFFNYASEVCEPEKYQIMRKSYDDFRLSEKLTYDNKPMFVVQDNDIIENPELVDGAKPTYQIFNVYYKNAYAKYIDDYLQSYLVTDIPHYYNLTKYFAIILIFAEILPAYAFAGILVYLVPPLIFRRGRKTIGKLVYRVGLVDSRILSPKLGRTIARFSIFYFGELLLSLVTFGIPYIISFSMMVFTKSKQGFPDYMLRLNEVDSGRDKIFFNLEEIKLEDIKTNKDPVKFKVRNYD